MLSLSNLARSSRNRSPQIESSHSLGNSLQLNKSALAATEGSVPSSDIACWTLCLH